VIDILLSEQTYFAQKEILFSGLCAWTVCPHRPIVVQNAMVLAGISQLAKLELRTRRKMPDTELLADIIARVTGPGTDFYTDFYYPVGGLQTILEVGSPKILKRTIAKSSNNLDFVISVMRVLHFHAESMQGNADYRTASVKSACEAVSRLRKRTNADRALDPVNIARLYSPISTPAALIYAANSIVIDRDHSFLSIMRSGDASFASQGHLFTEWVRRAVYVGKAVLTPTFSRVSRDAQLGFLPELPPVAIAPPLMPDEEIQQIRLCFSKKLSAAKRATILAS
jgi:hypothetical protein